MKRTSGGECFPKKGDFIVANMKKHCSGCCSGWYNGYAQADCANGASNRSGCGCSACGKGQGCGCSSGGSGRCSCGSGNGFGALHSVTGPFSNCGNWWNNANCFPYYTGPCGPCKPCRNCCCRDWPWPFMPPMPMMNGEAASDEGERYAETMNDTSYKNCYRTEASAREACAASCAKPIVDCPNCRCGCADN